MRAPALEVSTTSLNYAPRLRPYPAIGDTRNPLLPILEPVHLVEVEKVVASNL